MAVTLTVIITIGFLQVCAIVKPTGAACDGLRVFDGDTEVNDYDCTLFPTSSCRNGPSSFPGNLSVGTTVGPPRNFKVEVFQRNFTRPTGPIYASGATYMWDAPIDGTSRKHIKGFHLRLRFVNSGKVICRLIDLQEMDLTKRVRTRFAFELFPFTDNEQKTHIATLTSLPPPTDDEYEAGLVEQAIYSIPGYFSYTDTKRIYPNGWSTWIVVKKYNDVGAVEVKFGYPTVNSSAEFSSFYVHLVNKMNPTNPQMQIIYNRTNNEAMGAYNFTNVPTGEYKIQVTPRDLFLNVIGKCQCWTREPGYRTCHPCTTTLTEYFNFTNTVPTTQQPTSADVTVDSPTTLSPQDSTPIVPGNSPNIALIVTLTVLPLLIFSIFAAMCMYRRGILKLGKSSKRNIDQENPNVNNNWLENLDQNSNEGPKDHQTVEISRKKILLLASDDHEYFTQAVERLAIFLQVHCMCDVTFAPQQMPQLRHTGSYCWLSQQIDSADFVIIVTSEAALQLYLASREGKGYTQAMLGPEGDLFTPGIKHICGKIANNQDVRNIMMVYFDHTASHCRLPIFPLQSFHYHLPNHLPTFLRHIHGLHSSKMDLSQVNLPLMGNVEELNGGKEWLEAVQQAKEYEQLNPSWFNEKFGKPTELYSSLEPKPDCNRQDSDDSGYTEGRNFKELKHRLSSVSTNAEGVVDQVDCGVDNLSFCRDDFIEPSIYTANTAYTVPYPDDDRPSEIDERSLSEEFHKLNQHYEQKLQQDQTPCAEEFYPSGSLEDLHVSQVRHSNQTQRDFIRFVPSDEDHDCISVSSVQSV